MITLRRLSLLALLVAAAALLIGFALNQAWLLGLLAWLPVGLWPLSNKRRATEISHFNFVWHIALSALGALYSLPSWLVFLAVALALAAWDLVAFERRLRPGRLENGSQIIMSHLLRLGGVIAVAWLLFFLTQAVRLQLDIWSALLLGTLLLLGLVQTTRLMRRR